MLQTTLTQLVQTSPCAHDLILAFARNHPLVRYCDAEDAHKLLQSQGLGYPQSDVRRAFGAMARCGLGQAYSTGITRGDDKSFRWAVLPLAVLEAMRTGVPLALDTVASTAGFEPAPDDIIPRTLPVHRFLLRPDCTVRLDLPDDLTRHELKRLRLFLSSLVSEAHWPFATRGDELLDDELLKEEEELDFDDGWLEGDEIVSEDDFADMGSSKASEAEPPKSGS